MSTSTGKGPWPSGRARNAGIPPGQTIVSVSMVIAASPSRTLDNGNLRGLSMTWKSRATWSWTGRNLTHSCDLKARISVKRTLVESQTLAGRRSPHGLDAAPLSLPHARKGWPHENEQIRLHCCCVGGTLHARLRQLLLQSEP